METEMVTYARVSITLGEDDYFDAKPLYLQENGIEVRQIEVRIGDLQVYASGRVIKKDGKPGSQTGSYYLDLERVPASVQTALLRHFILNGCK